MTKIRSILFLAAPALLFGCTAGTKATGNPGSAGSSAGAAGSSGGGTTGTGGSSSGTGGNSDASFDITVGDHSNDGVCATTMTAAAPVPLDLYVLMDSSLSMNESTSSTSTKWKDVQTAMSNFFSSGSTAGLGVGLKFFPGEQADAMPTCSQDGTADTAECGTHGPCDRRKTCVASGASTTAVTPFCTQMSDCGTQTCALIEDCGSGNYCAKGPTAATTACMSCNTFAGYCHLRDHCDAAYYATPDVAVAALDGTTGGQAAALNAALSAHSPGGYTPTGPALTGALMFARSRIAAMPTHRVAIVLVTDGLPGGFIPGFPPAECLPGDIAGISALASGTMGAGGSPPVLTFVIGMFTSGTAAQTAQTNLDQLATAGGTAPAVIITTGQDISGPLQSALKSVQTKAIACDFQIPATGVDFKKVNVQFTSGSGSVTAIGHAPPDGTAGSACDTRGGWYYDVDPASGTPTKITACPASCQMFQTDLNGHVDVLLGCPTIDVD